MEAVNPQQETIAKFRGILPALREWIDDTLSASEKEAVTVSSLGFQGLPRHLPQELLDRARVVTVRRVPFPPVSEMGLPELGQMERMQLAGVTFKDTFFVHQSHRTESLHFHELVHVVQWDRLGVDKFLLAYGAGLVQFGYEKSPLEQMAYTLQANFERGVLPPNVIRVIHERTDAYWQQVAPLVQQG